MFYLTMHSAHFIYSYMASDIWLRTILIAREQTCCRHTGYSFQLAARVLLYASSSIITHTTAFVALVMEHWLEREIAKWVHHEGSIRRPIASSLNATFSALLSNMMRSERRRRSSQTDVLGRGQLQYNII